MEMTIEEARTALGKERKYALHENKQAYDIAMSILRKYQKIEQIVEHWACCGNPSDSMIAISEVLEDGRN